jgi:REP element-mobilizing transposase RayT
MPRSLRRFQSEHVFEITSRTVGSRFSFVPTRFIRQEWIGILAEAKSRWPQLKLHQAVVMSSHVHMLISCGDANVVAKWASFVFAATARMAQFHHRIEGRVWSRRFRAIPILDDEALHDRIRYLMAQACNPDCDLVTAPRHWPGLSCVDALCRGARLEGTYTTADERRRLLRETGTLPINRRLELDPIACLPNAPHAHQAWFRRVEKAIVQETRRRHQDRGIVCPPPRMLTTFNPNHAPDREKRSPAPACHTSCLQRRHAFCAEYREFAKRWREALKDLIACVRVRFPTGSWWPFGCQDRFAPQLE